MNRQSTYGLLDARSVVRAYAVLAGAAGLLLVGWGPMWLGVDLPSQPFGMAALVRVFGSILVAAACCVLPFALPGLPTARRALVCYAAAHLAVFIVLALQQSAIWGPGLGQQAMRAVGVCAGLLWIFYVHDIPEMDTEDAGLISLFGRAKPRTTTVQLRSQYEQQIREAARQEERNRLARELHDSIKQQIFVIQTAAATVQARLDADGSGARQALDQVRDSAREAMTEMQVMLDQLRAVPLENNGLIESLRKQCDALGFRTGAQVQFSLGTLPAAERLAPGAHEAIVRVAQESLANVARHARATHVQVSLRSVRDQVELRIEDDGTGFDPERNANGQGIGNMNARAAEFGGSFDLTSRPGAGTSITFSIPCDVVAVLDERRKWALIGAVCAIVLMPILAWKGPFGVSLVSTLALIGGVRYAAYRIREARERKNAEAVR